MSWLGVDPLSPRESDLLVFLFALSGLRDARGQADVNELATS